MTDKEGSCSGPPLQRLVRLRSWSTCHLSPCGICIQTFKQIDNQLPKAEARVILGPTPVQTPQPLLQFALERNKHKHHADLYSLQYVFVLLQVRGAHLDP